MAKKRKARRVHSVSVIIAECIKSEPAWGEHRVLHPVRSALFEAALFRCGQVFQSLYQGHAISHVQLSTAWKEMIELLGWCARYPNRREAVILGELTRAFPEDAASFLTAAMRPFRGKPISRRLLAVTALELRLADPKLSWTKLAWKLCNC